MGRERQGQESGEGFFRTPAVEQREHPRRFRPFETVEE